MKDRVFVTDASYPNSLAAVRALGEAGFSVTVGERASLAGAQAISFWSRYCERRFVHPDPRSDEGVAVAALSGLFAVSHYSAAIPVSLDLSMFFAKHRAKFAVPLMLPPQWSFDIAADKRATFARAETLGLAVPQTRPLAQWEEFELPLVIKHVRKGAWIARSLDEARRYVDGFGDRADEYVAQEYVPGENGFGYFGFFVEGLERAFFMHERLQQFPREGGPSVVARAIRDPQLREAGRALLEDLQWHGVAMVEFKRSDRDGRFYLMEVNPKLWGSLELAIAAGANFPVWIARYLTTGTVPERTEYCEGMTCQWVIPNGIKSFLRYPEFRAQFLRNLVAPSVKKDVSLRDPLPSAAGVFTMAANLVKG